MCKPSIVSINAGSRRQHLQSHFMAPEPERIRLEPERPIDARQPEIVIPEIQIRK